MGRADDGLALDGCPRSNSRRSSALTAIDGRKNVKGSRVVADAATIAADESAVKTPDHIA
jgi:hypothetical protein